MNRTAAYPGNRREKMTQGAALACLLVLGGLALAGPSGVLAWGEYSRMLEDREAQIAELETERDELANRVALLDPDHADPDLVGELLRENFGVAHPDEVMIAID